MKLSVLMSVYEKDSPEHLRLALRSIYEDQTRKPDEIVVVFDGPLPQALLDVLHEFSSAGRKKEIVRYLPQEKNAGLGRALQIGQEYCTGDYIFRMDADDISAPTRFERQLAFLSSNPVDVLGTDTAEFRESPEEEKRICRFPATHEEILRLARRRNPINHMSVCIRRQALLQCGGYQPLPLLENYYLWLRMMQAGCRFANLNEPLVYVRVGNGFYQRRSAARQVQGWRFLQDYMLSHGMITRTRRRLNMIIVRVFVSIPPWLKRWVYAVFLRRKK